MIDFRNMNYGANFRKMFNLYYLLVQRGDHCNHVVVYARLKMAGKA